MFYFWRNFLARLCIISCASVFATGCSMHPLPEDISPASTVVIVKSIRCEALAGLESFRAEEKLRAASIIKATFIGFDFRFDISEANSAAGGDDLLRKAVSRILSAAPKLLGIWRLTLR